jgi:O-antigen/teichoic acid export membrane protein
MLVGSLLGSTMLGLYSVAVAFAGLTQIFAVCLALVALPQIASLQKDPDAEAPFVRKWVLTSAGMLAVVVGGLELILVPALKLTFGEDFIDATDSTRWMLVASGLLGFRRVLIAVLQGRDRGRVASMTELALTPLMVLGIVLAAAADSLVAVGVTMVGVGAASCLVLGVFVLRSEATGIDVRQEAEPLQT